MSTDDATLTVSRIARSALTALLTTHEVASLLRVSPRTVDRWAIEGRLPRIQVGARAVRYRADDIAALIGPSNESDGTEDTAPSLETSPGGHAQHASA